MNGTPPKMALNVKTAWANGNAPSTREQALLTQLVAAKARIRELESANDNRPGGAREFCTPDSDLDQAQLDARTNLRTAAAARMKSRTARVRSAQSEVKSAVGQIQGSK